MIESDPPLSIEGIARREKILRLARRQATKMRRRRKFVRTACGFAAIVLIAILWKARIFSDRVTAPDHLAVMQSKTSAPQMPAVTDPAPQESSPTMTITWIQTDPTITDRLAIRPQPPQWKTIDDDQLLQSMAEAGHPAGLIEMNGRTYLLPR